MRKEIDLISVGYHKGEVDFSVNSSIEDLTLEELKKIREMLVVAIWCAEDMWRRKHQVSCGKTEITPPKEGIKE